MAKALLNFLITILAIIIVTSCVASKSASKKVKSIDFSVVDTTDTVSGCGTSKYVTFQITTSTSTTNPTDVKYACNTECPATYHVTTTTELNNFKDKYGEVENVLTILNDSKGLCISDSAAVRPTAEVYISSDFCSCLNGKKDIINDCESFCANKTSTTTAKLFVNATLGSPIANNKSLGSLYNWCNVQLENDSTSPQCTLTAFDGTNTIDNIPVTVNKTTNSFSADISSLAYGTTYVMTLVESKTGSNAASTNFQIRRIRQSTIDESTLGALKITPISQYSCLSYGGSYDSSGNLIRSSYSKLLYYFPASDTPAAIPPTSTNGQNLIVCHDEISHSGNDNAMYERYELIPSHITLWDQTDPRFVKTNEVMAINKTIQERLYDEFGVSSTMDLFSLLKIANRPNVSSSSSSSSSSSTATSNYPQGYMMIPFIDNTNGKAYCPNTAYFEGNYPLFKVLKNYIPDTEGLYLGEKEAEQILNGTSYQTIYGTMLINESKLLKYGFYVLNGVKVKINANNIHNKTVYYYWPVSDTMDSLLQGDRKLFTVRTPNTLQGNVPTVTNTAVTSDKRIGCIPKSN